MYTLVTVTPKGDLQMVTKSNEQSNAKGKKEKVKILNLNKESVKDLTNEQKKRVKGGIISAMVSTTRIK
jgi:hypothetical protein